MDAVLRRSVQWSSVVSFAPPLATKRRADSRVRLRSHVNDFDPDAYQALLAMERVCPPRNAGPPRAATPPVPSDCSSYIGARPLHRSFLAGSMPCMRRASIRGIVGLRLGNDLQNAEAVPRAVWKRPLDRLAHGQADQGAAHGREHGYRSRRRVRFVGKHDRNFTALPRVLILESNSTVHPDYIGRNGTRIDHDSSLQLGRESRMARKTAQQREIGSSDDDGWIVWHGAPCD
jgi:hypothetical protein